MMGPAFSQLDLEAVQARQSELSREYRQAQRLKEPTGRPSRVRGAIRAVTSRI